MGTLTLAELKEEVRANFGNRTDLDTRLTRVLNLAQERLARMRDFEEMQVTTTTTLSYTGVPATDVIGTLPDVAPYIREIHSVLLKDGTMSRKLRRVLTRTWDRVITDPAAIGAAEHPVMYQIWNFRAGTFEVYPPPNKTFTLQWRLTQWPTPLSGDTDVSIFRFKDELLIELATVYLGNQLGKEDDASKHWKKFRELFAEALEVDAQNSDVEVMPTSASGQGTLPMNYWQDPFVKGMP